jgi:hypothetical protein
VLGPLPLLLLKLQGFLFCVARGFYVCCGKASWPAHVRRFCAGFARAFFPCVARFPPLLLQGFYPLCCKASCPAVARVLPLCCKVSRPAVARILPLTLQGFLPAVARVFLPCTSPALLQMNAWAHATLGRQSMSTGLIEGKLRVIVLVSRLFLDGGPNGSRRITGGGWCPENS